MANVGYATLQVIPSLKGFSSKLRLGMGGALTSEGKKAGEDTGRSFASSFAKVAAGAAVAVGAIRLGKGFVDAAIESQKVSKQTEAVLKSMGNTAGLTASDIGKLAEKQSMLSGVDDEVIQSAQNVLLTFGKVRNEVGKGNDIFNRGSQAALDMSVALKQDLQGATIQIGKALNDPIKGITALARAGVSFTEQQKDQIKAMVAAGDTMGAQKLILSELENQFGGSAKAQATAGERLKVVFGNLQEQLGKYLLPVVEKVASFLATNLPKAMEAAGRAIAPLVEGWKAFVKTLTTGFTENEGTPIERFALRVREAAMGVVDFFKRNWPQIKAVALAVFDALVAAAGKLAGFVVTKLVPALVKIGQWVVKNKPVLIGIATAIGTFLVGAFISLVGAFISWALAAGAAAIATIAAAAPVLLLGAAIAALVAGLVWAYQNVGWFRTAVDAVAQFITGVVVPAFQWLLDKIMFVFGWVRDNWQLLLAILTGPIGLAVKFIVDHFTGIKDAIQTVVDFIATVGSTMWNGLKSGLTAVANFIIGGLEGILGAVVSLINGAIRAYNAIPLVNNIDTIGKPKLKRFGGDGGTVDFAHNQRAAGLAGGGIVHRRPGGVFANIGEGRNDEAVMPLSAQGLRPFAAALAPHINGSGLALELSVARGADQGAMDWILNYVRVNPGARQTLRKALAA